MKKFDAIIIGSGQAGNPLAFKLASEGRKIALIEKKQFGGTCVNTGCTPTKAYVASARRAWEARNSQHMGVIIPEGVHVDLRHVKKRTEELVLQSVTNIKSRIENENNISFYKGAAKFTGTKTVIVNNEQLTANQIFINVGARPTVPENFEDLDYLTNETILQLEQLPGHLVIVGGSYNGLEFGQMFRRFGSQVTIVEKENRIIHNEDEEISDSILEFMEDEGTRFRLNAKCIGGVQNSDGTITLKVDCKEDEPEITCTHLLLAAGRTPNTDILNLEACGVETDEKGYIKVNDFLETKIPGIYALGECNGKGLFTHTAYNDFEIIMHNLKEKQKRKVSDRIMTYALYTDPPLGRAGLTRQEALDRGFKIKEAKLPMDQVARAKEKGETKGLMHLIADADSRKILGAAILGVSGDEVISSILHIMYADVTWDVIIKSVKPHPTVSELLPTLLLKLKDID